MLEIQKFCGTFRKRTLRKTLRDIELEQGVNIKTISAFENGRSNNIEHLAIYVKACDNQVQRIYFTESIQSILLGVGND